MVTAEELANAGYRQFRDESVHLKGGGCERLWQKKAEDAHGIRYYINFFEWNLKKMIPSYPGRSPSFEAEVQFLARDGSAVNVNLPAGEFTVDEVEAFFARMWETMGFAHTEKHDWVLDQTPMVATSSAPSKRGQDEPVERPQ